jgi:hypothetical protein
MKNAIRLSFAICIALALVSWGKIGHFTVGRIAEKHLSAKAITAIHELIGDTSLADISTYADEVRQQDAYKYTFYFHFINLPLGLQQNNFNSAVLQQTKDNVYSALSKFSNDLISPRKTKAERVFALKMIVHLVGDLHQPMHVSREEDQGGNTIKISFLGKPGNLHGLWDSNLIEHAGLNDMQLATKIDHATPQQIKQWQHNGILNWLYESYQVSTQLYADAAKKPDFDEAYYQAHMPLIEQRLEKGGIRLAGILNEIFGGGPYKIVPPPSAKQ